MGSLSSPSSSTLPPDPYGDLENVKLPIELSTLSNCLEERPEALATGDENIRDAALQAAKYVFDLALKMESKSNPQIVGLLSSMAPSEAPKTRSQTAAENKKRKRNPSPSPSHPKFPVPAETPLQELCVDGMDEDQLWAQLDLRAKNVCEVLEYALEGTGMKEEDEEAEAEFNALKRRKMMLGVDEGMDGMDVDGMEDWEEDNDEEDAESDEEGGEEEGKEEEGHLGESMAELHDPSDEDDEEDELDLDQEPSFLSAGKRKLKPNRRTGGHPELDDGFFNLAAFNAEIEEAEARTVSKGKLGRDEDREEEDEGDADVDYFATVDEDAEADDTPIFYKDFFEAPSRSVKRPKEKAVVELKSSGQVRFHDEVRVRNIKPKGKGLPVNAMFSFEEEEDDDEGDYDEGNGEGDDDHEDTDEDEDEDVSMPDSNEFGSSSEEEEQEFDPDNEDEYDFQIREAINRAKDDLFAEDDESPDESNMTTYEKRTAALREEIAQLESENVAQKHWTLMGEANSRSRPQNALLEEDLEFERVMKSVPVITEETVQGLEERIRARIIEERFDDVVRKRPVDDKPFLPSRLFELQDTKSKQSLAEIYEEEYTAAQSGGVAGEDRNGKLQKEHKEIEKLWENICYKLDALSNAHFTPKAPKATISTIANVAAASMESALPTTAATSTMLAPEEVFTPSPTDLVAKSELTPAQKRALHNKQKKAKRKARDTVEKSVDKFSKLKGIKGVKQQKDAALKSLVKTGKAVTVIGKKSQEIGHKAKPKHS